MTQYDLTRPFDLDQQRHPAASEADTIANELETKIKNGDWTAEALAIFAAKLTAMNIALPDSTDPLDKLRIIVQEAPTLANMKFMPEIIWKSPAAWRRDHPDRDHLTARWKSDPDPPKKETIVPGADSGRYEKER